MILINCRFILDITRTTLFAAIGLSSCNNDSPTPMIWYDSSSFPMARYASVSLLVLDSGVKTTFFSDSLGYTINDRKVVEYIGGAGYSFVDKNGLPKTSLHKAYSLDSSQIRALQTLLSKQPCLDSVVTDKTCAPTYKNVFIFYDEEKKPVAQVHVCYRCEMAQFIPGKYDMCDFDNKINWKKFKNFRDQIISNRAE